MENNTDNIRYTHDCDCCVYLGNHDHYDLYFCGSEPTVIARYGNDGQEYISGLVFAKPDKTKALYIAKTIAIKQGLLKQ